MKKTKTVMIFIFSALVTFLLASIGGTQIVLAEIQGFGLDVSLSDRFAASFHDMLGLAPVLFVLISAALLVAFTVAALGKRFLGGKRTFWYLAAGFASLPATLVLIKSIMGVTVFAAARTGFGLSLVALCGLVGGFLFSRLTQQGGSE